MKDLKEAKTLKELGKSESNVVNFQMIGYIAKDDYQALVVEDLVGQSSNIRLLLDMDQFKGEESTWGAEFRLGTDFRKKVEKLAIVGDKRWEKWLTSLVDPFYVKEVTLFKVEDLEQAWAWLQE